MSTWTMWAIAASGAGVIGVLHHYGLAKLLRWFAVHALSVAEGLESYRIAQKEARMHWTKRLIGSDSGAPLGDSGRATFCGVRAMEER